jgi:hypothetical protein
VPYVSRVNVLNIVDLHDNSARLSNSVVSLLNYQGHALKTYRIGDAKNIPVFHINFELYISCYNDGPVRDLVHFGGVFSVNNHDQCGQRCSELGYLYAGTQNSEECWCGNRYGRHGPNTGGCRMTCRGTSSEMCGGPYENSVYKSNCKPPCGPPH